MRRRENGRLQAHLHHTWPPFPFFMLPKMTEMNKSGPFQVSFCDEHDRLYAEAKRTSNHSAVTSHYYSVMSAVIDDYFNGNFHFVPPQHERQTLEEALVALHKKVAECLKLEKGNAY
ncbi:hypothetical protein Tcan_01169, partial [Toxocara canis]